MPALETPLPACFPALFPWVTARTAATRCSRLYGVRYRVSAKRCLACKGRSGPPRHDSKMRAAQRLIVRRLVRPMPHTVRLWDALTDYGQSDLVRGAFSAKAVGARRRTDAVTCGYSDVLFGCRAVSVKCGWGGARQATSPAATAPRATAESLVRAQCVVLRLRAALCAPLWPVRLPRASCIRLLS